jgi:hypothetical protein
MIRSLGKAHRAGSLVGAAVPPPAPPPTPATPAGMTPGTQFDVQALVRESEDLRGRASLADARAGFEKLYADHRGFQDRVAALGATVVCPPDDLAATLDALGQQWFAPEVSEAVYKQIDQLAAGLTTEAGTIADQITADPAALADATLPAAVIMRERINGLGRRIDDAIKEVGAMFADLTSAHGQVRQRIEGLERTVHAVGASGLDHGQLNLGCVAYCRKVRIEGRGTGYVTLAGQHMVFQPVETNGILLWKSDHVGSAEVIDLSGGLTLTDVHRPILGDHRVTLRHATTGASYQLALGREALDDLVNAAS